MAEKPKDKIREAIEAAGKDRFDKFPDIRDFGKETGCRAALNSRRQQESYKLGDLVDKVSAADATRGHWRFQGGDLFCIDERVTVLWRDPTIYPLWQANRDVLGWPITDRYAPRDGIDPRGAGLVQWFQNGAIMTYKGEGWVVPNALGAAWRSLYSDPSSSFHVGYPTGDPVEVRRSDLPEIARRTGRGETLTVQRFGNGLMVQLDERGTVLTIGYDGRLWQMFALFADERLADGRVKLRRNVTLLGPQSTYTLTVSSIRSVEETDGFIGGSGSDEVRWTVGAATPFTSSHQRITAGDIDSEDNVYRSEWGANRGRNVYSGPVPAIMALGILGLEVDAATPAREALEKFEAEAGDGVSRSYSELFEGSVSDGTETDVLTALSLVGHVADAILDTGDFFATILGAIPALIIELIEVGDPVVIGLLLQHMPVDEVIRAALKGEPTRLDERHTRQRDDVDANLTSRVGGKLGKVYWWEQTLRYRNHRSDSEYEVKLMHTIKVSPS